MRHRLRKKWIKAGLIAVLPVLLLAGCGKKNGNGSQTQQPAGRTVTFTSKVAFLSDQGDTVASVRVAVAKTEEQQNEGLMDVHSLPEDGGMLFIFKNEQQRNFWMANTPLPLDIIFINSQKKIVRIFRSTQPYSETNLDSGQPAQYVVEVNGGYTIDHNINEGMKVSF